jgi:hypothetical protein
MFQPLPFGRDLFDEEVPVNKAAEIVAGLSVANDIHFGATDIKDMCKATYN